ncbi:MAG: alpha/beta hydrolase [Hyphomonadaceae bacterium]|jgi:pimeloyl-ACP methyl ester carboxylesterase|nr:alpha/beta hydrolase [Hyphomonadaceae bacterium]
MARFVICHGAWSAAWAWKKVRPLLRAAGHEIITPTCTGLGERAHQASRAINLETHIADVLAVLDYEDLRDVALVGHSYGGMVATGVADRAPERIARLIYLDAFVPDSGQSLIDLLPEAERTRRQEAVRAEGDGWLLPPNPPPPDTSPEDIAWITPRWRWQPIGTFMQPLVLKNAGAHLPRAYIYCTRLGPGDTFGQFARRFRSDPGWQLFEIDASHSPNVTVPEALARLLDQIAR